jgi:hypothetical protein
MVSNMVDSLALCDAKSREWERVTHEPAMEHTQIARLCKEV